MGIIPKLIRISVEKICILSLPKADMRINFNLPVQTGLLHDI